MIFFCRCHRYLDLFWKHKVIFRHFCLLPFPGPPALMDDNEKQPGPLRIVKRHPENLASKVEGSRGLQKQALNILPSQGASEATENNASVVLVGSAANQQPGSISKEQIKRPTRIDGGASRFHNSAAAHSACLARRRLNETQYFGSGSDDEFASPDQDYEVDERYASVRSQYLRNAHHVRG